MPFAPFRKRRRSAGFTAAEAVIALLFLAMLIALGVSVIRNGIRDRDAQEFEATAAFLAPAHFDRFVAAVNDPKKRALHGTDGSTYLHRAGVHANDPAAVWLLDRGEDVNVRTKDGRTPLLFALDEVAHEIAHDNLVRYVTLLIDHGTDVDARDAAGRSPLHAAAAKPEPSFTLLLLNAGANANVEAETSPTTPLAVAAERCHYSVLQTLLVNGAEANGGTQRGEPLYLAAEGGHHAIVIALLDAGADPNGGVFVPLRGAMESGNRNIAQLLIKHGARELPDTVNAP